MKNKFYITTTLPYVNADPHIGFALELAQADVMARYQKGLGKEVIFNTGTDEHGIKVYRAALEEKKDIQAYVDEYAAKFEALKKAFNISWTNFIRTTDPHHIAACQEFWKRCSANGDIYKKDYKIKYCVGCELEKTESELDESGRCLLHPNLKVETRDEENYFFRFSKYQKPLLEFYEKNPDFVVPDFRFNEIKNFVKQGLNDFSISRLKEKMPWGVPVPDDEAHVTYVWFDALINYISTLGWPEDEKTFKNFWPGVQIAGKDNLRQQSAMWQAMLMSAGLPNSRQILIHGFIILGGQKISKSLGNVVDPFEVVKKYGVDPVRYYLLREIPSDEDGDFSTEKLEARYNGDLANNLGNLVSRVAKLIETKLEGELVFENKFLDKEVEKDVVEAQNACGKKIDEFKLHEALAGIFELLGHANRYIDDNKPWVDVADHPEHFLKTMTSLVYLIINASKMVEPFLPETAEKIFKTFGYDGKSKELEGYKFAVAKTESLFPRIK
jgi:methionyl-tRNA synthetase